MILTFVMGTTILTVMVMLATSPMLITMEGMVIQTDLILSKNINPCSLKIKLMTFELCTSATK